MSINLFNTKPNKSGKSFLGLGRYQPPLQDVTMAPDATGIPSVGGIAPDPTSNVANRVVQNINPQTALQAPSVGTPALGAGVLGDPKKIPLMF